MTHSEGFKLMQYACPSGHVELIWNSRDGVTPFGIRCRFCPDPTPQTAQHVRWHEDAFSMSYNPPRGHRYFRDGRPEEAAAIMRARIERMREEYPCTPEEEAELIRSARDGDDGGEFQHGWPMLVTRGDDNDTLTHPLPDAPLPRTERFA